MVNSLEFPLSNFVDLPGTNRINYSEFKLAHSHRHRHHHSPKTASTPAQEHPPVVSSGSPPDQPPPSPKMITRALSKRLTNFLHWGAQHPSSGSSSCPRHGFPPPAQSGSRALHARPSSSREDIMATLVRYDTIFLVDDSASMAQQGRWQEAGAALSAVVKAAVQYDADGIDIYFLNSTAHRRNVRSPQEVVQLFNSVQPTGPSTPIDVRVEALTSLHLNLLEASKYQGQQSQIKPMNLIIITDGATDDPDTLLYTIASVANRLEENRFPLSQLGIQFIQIGNDREATEFLRKLDSELKTTYGVKRDIVDTTLYKGRLSGDFILKTLLGGINRRIDADRSSSR